MFIDNQSTKLLGIKFPTFIHRNHKRYRIFVWLCESYVTFAASRKNKNRWTWQTITTTIRKTLIKTLFEKKLCLQLLFCRERKHLSVDFMLIHLCSGHLHGTATLPVSSMLYAKVSFHWKLGKWEGGKKTKNTRYFMPRGHPEFTLHALTKW